MSRTTPARYSVHALPQAVADYVRAHGRDPVWGHDAVTERATGLGPCRLCLRTFREDDRRTLFTHDSYSGVCQFPQPGPVYIHEEPCSRYDGDGFPPELERLELTFEAVAAGPRVVALERATGADADVVLGQMLMLRAVEYVNVRNTVAGCFVARVGRAESSAW